MKTNFQKQTMSFLRCVLFALTFFFSGTVFSQTDADDFLAPTVTDVQSCGADYVVLRATSEIIDEDLTFIWYDEDFVILGQEVGSAGTNEFITPYLIQDATFYVAIELNGQVSERAQVDVDIIHTPTIIEDPWIELCGSVTIEGEIDLFDTFTSITYQWQKLTASNETEVAYQDVDGETNITLTTTETGIYRFVVFLDDCIAISKGIEVTTGQVASALSEGNNDHCYTIGSDEDDIAFFTSQHYRERVTTVEWYRSEDFGGTYTNLIETTQSVGIEKPASIIDTEETWYYRLIVTEQNCAYQEDFVINWAPKPEGSIQHINGSADNFFYCETDAENTRTLEIVTSDNISVTWYRLLNPLFFSKAQHIALSTGTVEDMFDYFASLELTTITYDILGTNDQIILDQSTSGLIFAEITDLDNGCVEYTSNLIFADTPLAIPQSLFPAAPPIYDYAFTGVCQGNTEVELFSWDDTADTYSWFYSVDNTTYNQVGFSDTYTIEGITNPGNLEGFYKLGVEKNGCYDESDPFYIYESTPVEAIIETTGTQFCEEGDVVLSSQNQSDTISYIWYKSDEISPVGSSATFSPEEPGSYFFIIRNGYCASESDPISIDTGLAIDAIINASATSFCNESSIVLSSQNQVAGYDYAWYNIDDLNASLSSLMTFEPTEAGSYVLQISNGSACSSISEAVEIIENEFAEAIIEPSSTVLCQENNIELSSLNQDDGYNYAWYNFNDQSNSLSGSATFTPTEAGFYILEIDNGFCVSLSVPFELSQSSIPTTANFASPFDTEEIFCSSVNAVLTIQNTDDSYEWHQSSDNISFEQLTDENTFSYQINETGFYFATVTSQSGCQVNSDTIQIADLLDGTLNYDGVAFACANNNETTLWLTSPQSNHSYQWLFSTDDINYSIASGTSNLATYQTSELGYYKLEVTGTTCSLTTDPVEVQAATDSGINAVILGDEEACSNTPIVLTSTSDADTYSWFYKTADSELTAFSTTQKALTFDASSFISDANPTQEVEVYLGITDGNCSSLSEPIAIQANQSPELFIRNSDTNTSDGAFICNTRDGEINLEAVETSGSNTIDYQWSIYDIDSLRFNTIISANESTLNISQPGIYQCTATTSNTSCAVVSNPLQASFLPHEISGDSTYCLGDTFEVSVSADNSSSEIFDTFSYQWYHSDDNESFTAITTTQSSSLTVQTGEEGINGGYFYYIASFNTCEIISDTTLVEEDQSSVLITLEGGSVQEKGVPFKISANTNQVVDNIEWEPSEYVATPNTQDAIFTIPVNYQEDQIQITALVPDASCTSVQSFFIQLTEPQTLQFSKIITPDGDGYNDIFRVIGLGQVVSNSMQIFNAWGKMVYEVQDYDNSSSKGETLIKQIEDGNFYYIFRTENQTYKGSFHVKK